MVYFEIVENMIGRGVWFVLCDKISKGKSIHIIKWCLLTLAPVDIVDLNKDPNILNLYSDCTSSAVLNCGHWLNRYLVEYNKAGPDGTTLTEEGLERLLFGMWMDKYEPNIEHKGYPLGNKVRI